MTGLVLRLAGLQQSWGERGVFHHRDTTAFPTRSALIGMFAAAQGRSREEALTPYQQLPGTPSHKDLTFTIRIDTPGTLHRDFHTVGGGHPPERRLRTGDGGQRSPVRSTLVSHRDYLTGAVFTLAVEGPDALIDHIASTLTRPRFAPYLGRRSCLPDEPLVVSAHSTDPVTELRERIPLTLAAPPRDSSTHLPVRFVWERPPPTAANVDPDRESTSEPVDLTSAARRHLPRPLWLTTERLRTSLYAGARPIDALSAYMLQGCP
ncbi:type I-E CRISPR-associated protein Cas5/CasD [Streptomyces sp. ISL-99]|uniref:type I-E CRISPR-associated protein Cas5/CasD n=1 Tax=Streptomyces sp. ISL-99 TaxID=2819193 RepID=UPI001BE9F5BE|nr:type I-E CRISPR-associated protein Cas5/CasD [Streptomyces sp. ISL-99]MBT2530136.1 type I-E CRISPR-associated protein Cas5/CasD [Streptomyces sp. ISL-99]